MDFDYEYKTQPYEFQDTIVKDSTDWIYVSLFNDPGTGKSKIMIDQFSWLYQQGKIDAVVIVAPNNVHLNWSSDEFPKHMPDSVLKQVKSYVWYSSKVSSQKAQKKLNEILEHKGLAVLLVAYEATITDKFKAYMRRFFAKRRVFMVLDESHRIKGRNAHVSKTLVAMGKHAAYRRILTGTPVEIPPDVYKQLKFLDQNFWHKHGFPTSTEFDSYFCEFEEKNFIRRGAGGKIIIGKDGKPLRNIFQQTVGYKNIDKLREIVATTGYRITMEMAGIHLPPVVYSKRYYEMFPQQRKMYDELREKYKTEFEDGQEITAEAAITRLLRLQQIICGYVGTGPGEPIRRIDEAKNPRLDLALEILEDLPHAALVWCRFTSDVDCLVDALGKQAVRYDGKVDNDGRALAKAAFQAGDAKYMVMTSAGAEGLTLVNAKTSMFYSNDFKMVSRIQKEARNVRIGQDVPTQCIDIVCEGTVDNDIINALREKRDLASQITGDTLKAWL